MSVEALHDAEERYAAIAPIIVCLPCSPRWVKDTFRKKMIRDEQEELLIDQQQTSQLEAVNTLWDRYADALREKKDAKEIEMIAFTNLIGQKKVEKSQVQTYLKSDLPAFSEKVQQAFNAHEKGLQSILEGVAIDDDSKNNVKQCLSGLHLSQMYLHAGNQVENWGDSEQETVKKDLCDNHVHCNESYTLATNLVLAKIGIMVDEACSQQVENTIKEELVEFGCDFCINKMPALSDDLRAGFAEYNKAKDTRFNTYFDDDSFSKSFNDAFNAAKKLLASAENNNRPSWTKACPVPLKTSLKAPPEMNRPQFSKTPYVIWFIMALVIGGMIWFLM